MTVKDSVKIQVEGKIDFDSAQIVIAKIRAAMQNEIKDILLVISPSAEIMSAEFISFLSIMAKHAQKTDGKIRISCGSEAHKALLRIASLGKLIEEAENSEKGE